jgi:cation:H+ antiporter
MFADLSLGGNIAVFLLSSALVWFAGTHVTRCADRLQARTGIGEAMIGMLLLGFISALPELAVTVSASWSGNAQLAVNNLLGGMAFNVAILAAADAAVREEALTSAVASPTPLLQAALLIVLLAVVAASTLIGDTPLLGASAWSWTILLLYLVSLAIMHRTRGREPWVPYERRSEPRLSAHDGTAEEGASERGGSRPLVIRIAVGAAVILAAGYAVSESGDGLAEQTGLGESFFGAVFLAVSTSLPEISIVFSAVRIGRYEMAISDIFGANLFGLALIFVVDLVYGEGPVLSQVGTFSTFAALLGILVTALFVAGLLERRHAKVMRMGLDSIAVLATYAIGLVFLYGLR